MKQLTQLFFVFILISVTSPAFARSIPSLTGPVVDEVGILSDSANSQISQSLRQYKKNTGNQFQVLIIKSLEGESLEGFSIRVVDTWKLGDARADNGALLLIAYNDKKIRIEVGQGLEGSLTDVKAGRIINQDIMPYFKKGDFQSGIVNGLNKMIEAIGGELTGAPEVKKIKSSIITTIIKVVFGLFFFISVFGGMFSGGTRRRRRGFLGGYYGGSSFGSSSGGFSGGGWSGGGGGFSGGGASGGW